MNFLSNRQKKLFPGIVLLITVVLMVVQPADLRETASSRLLDNDRMRLVPEGSNDTLFTNYQKISDSIEKISQWRKQRLIDGGNGVYALFIGVRKIVECTTCTDINEKNTESKHYVSMRGFALKQNTNFHMEGNEYYITRADQQPPEKTEIRLAATKNDSGGLTLLLPVSASWYKALKIIMGILMVITVLLAVCIFVWLPVRLLMNIAKGKAFIPQNIRDLRIIGWGLLGTILILVVMPLLIQWIFSSKIPSGIYFPFWSALFDGRWVIYLAVAILLTARAFRSGYNLQQEQDLTI